MTERHAPTHRHPLDGTFWHGTPAARLPSILDARRAQSCLHPSYSPQRGRVGSWTVHLTRDREAALLFGAMRLAPDDPGEVALIPVSGGALTRTMLRLDRSLVLLHAPGQLIVGPGNGQPRLLIKAMSWSQLLAATGCLAVADAVHVRAEDVEMESLPGNHREWIEGRFSALDASMRSGVRAVVEGPMRARFIEPSLRLEAHEIASEALYQDMPQKLREAAARFGTRVK